MEQQGKPTFNAKKEFLVHSHYETLNNKVLEHFKVETINIYYAKVNDVSELETENIRNGTKALVNGVDYIFIKKQWIKK